VAGGEWETVEEFGGTNTERPPPEGSGRNRETL